MTVAAHDITKLTTRSTRANTAYGDLGSGALQIASGEFTVGETYLLVIMGALDGSSTNGNYGCRVVHGSTAFADSEKNFEPATATNRVQYFWFHEWVAVSGEAITVQFKASTGSIGADKFILHAFKKGGSDGITYEYNEDGGDLGLTTTFQDGASVAFSAAANEKWVLAWYAQVDPATSGDTVEVDGQGDLSGADTLTIGLNREEPEDPALDFLTQGFISGHVLASGSHTWKQQSALESGTLATRLHSKVLAFKLSQFKDASVFFSQTNVDLGTTSFGNEVATLTHDETVGAAHDVIVIASTRNDHTVAGAGTGSHHRLQTGNADTPADQSSVNGGVGWDYRGPLNDGQDNDPWIMSDKVNISADATVDSDADGTTTTMDLKDRSIIVFSLELAAAGGITEADASAAGAATVSSVAAAIANGVTAAAGVAASAVVGVALWLATAAAPGVATADAPSATVLESVGSAAGAASSSVASVTMLPGVASSAGVGTASAEGADGASGGQGVADGVATVAGVGAATAQSNASGVGVASVSAGGATLTPTQGTVTATGAAAGVGGMVQAAVGSVAGVGAATASTQSLVAVVASSAGSGTASGAGQDIAIRTELGAGPLTAAFGSGPTTTVNQGGSTSPLTGGTLDMGVPN